MGKKIDLEGLTMDEILSLGYSYEMGEDGKGIDYDLAFECYKHVADAGHPFGLNALGWMYHRGYGVKVDLTKARNLYEQSSALGCGLAMVNLGNMCDEAEDYEGAYEWYQEAAIKEEPLGLFNLGNMYHWGWHVNQDYEKAYGYFKKLYDIGCNNECIDFYLGYYYECGIVVEQDYKKAIEFYASGMKKGDAFCACNLGRMYGLGLGVKKDEKRAFEMYVYAANKGDGTAYAGLGYCYEEGKGVEKDLDKALEMYKKGAELKDEYAIEELSRLKKEMQG